MDGFRAVGAAVGIFIGFSVSRTALIQSIAVKTNEMVMKVKSEGTETP